MLKWRYIVLEIRIEKGEDYCIARNKVVKVIRYSTSEDIEITDIQSKSDVLKSFKKLNKYEYVVVDTGEIKEYKFNNVKDVGGLKKSMKKLNQTLKNNFVGAENELFITLTAKRNVTDIRQMKMMFQQWWDKLRGLYDNLEFASIYEKHIDRDSWHIHTIIKATEHKRLFIPNNIIEDVWGYGFTKTSRIVNTPTSNEIREDYRMAYRNKITERFGINKVINYMYLIKKNIAELLYSTIPPDKAPQNYRISVSELSVIIKLQYQDFFFLDPFTDKIFFIYLL